MTRARVAAAVALLAVVGMARSAWFHFVSEPHRGVARASIDQRYRAVKEILPRSGEIGYLSDLPPPLRLGGDDDSRGAELYVGAQYALAPLILRPGPEGAGVVLANLSDPARLQQIAAERGLSVVAVAGPGVAVLRPRRR